MDIAAGPPDIGSKIEGHSYHGGLAFSGQICQGDSGSSTEGESPIITREKHLFVTRSDGFERCDAIGGHGITFWSWHNTKGLVLCHGFSAIALAWEKQSSIYPKVVIAEISRDRSAAGFDQSGWAEHCTSGCVVQNGVRRCRSPVDATPAECVVQQKYRRCHRVSQIPRRQLAVSRAPIFDEEFASG